MSKFLALALAATLIAPQIAEAKGPKHCPPGLAKKKPACVPPGLANKDRGGDAGSSYDDDDHDEHTLSVGDRVIFDGDEYVVVSTDGRTVLRRGDTLYRLPYPGDGSEYVRVGDAILRVDRKTKAVFEVIELADLIMN